MSVVCALIKYVCLFSLALLCAGTLSILWNKQEEHHYLHLNNNILINWNHLFCCPNKHLALKICFHSRLFSNRETCMDKYHPHQGALQFTYPRVPFPVKGGLGGFCVGGLVRGRPPPPAFIFWALAYESMTWVRTIVGLKKKATKHLREDTFSIYFWLIILVNLNKTQYTLHKE